MAHRLFVIHKEWEKTMLEMMGDNGGRETGRRAIATEVGNDDEDKSVATREHQVTGEGPGVCFGEIGIGVLWEKEPKYYDQNNSFNAQHDQHQVGMRQLQGRENTSLLQDSLSTNFLAEGTDDVLFAALALQQTARGGRQEGKGGTAGSTEKDVGGFIQTLGDTVSHLILVHPALSASSTYRVALIRHLSTSIQSLGGDEAESMVSFDTATFLHRCNGSLGPVGTDQQAHSSVVAAAPTTPYEAPHLGEKHAVVKNLCGIRGLQLVDQIPVCLPTLEDEYRVRIGIGSMLLPRKRRIAASSLSVESWISSLISNDGSVHEEHSRHTKMRAFVSLQDTNNRRWDNSWHESGNQASLSSNDAATMPEIEAPSRIVHVGGDLVSDLSVNHEARLDVEKHLEDYGNDDSHNYCQVLAEETDNNYLSPYQCELRKNLEIFEADPEEVKGSTTPGRKGKVALGQVGLRCCHCARVDRSSRSKGAVNYSCTVEGVYQIAQNMAKAHLSDKCAHISLEAKKRLVELRANSIRSYFKNCKKHWGDSIRKRGIYEVAMCDKPFRLMRRPSGVASSENNSIDGE
jgi:hypothetical protein